VVLEARVTLFKSIDFKAAWSLSKNMFVYKFSVQGNLYLARYKQLKFRLQGKFCGKITTTNGSNCNCGLRKHSLRYANLTVCDLKFRLWNYHKSHTLCLVCLIHASLNGISQVTFLLLDTIVFRRYRHTEMSLFVRRRSNVSFVTWLWKTSHCLIVWSYRTQLFLPVVEIAILSFAEYN